MREEEKKKEAPSLEFGTLPVSLKRRTKGTKQNIRTTTTKNTKVWTLVLLCKKRKEVLYYYY